MRHDTAGDPITGVKWSRRTTRKIAAELTAWGIAVSKNAVGRLLKEMDFKLRVNRKQIASTKNPMRNQQFLHIGEQRERFVNRGLPIISVDTKKKELIGDFKNAGAKWDREPILVKDHDFRSEAEGMAIPHGIYDTQANRGTVFVGTSHDTPAVDAIAQWWLKEGCQQYPAARELFILADGGGSNGARCRAWRKALQDTLCTPLGLTVTVSQLSPGRIQVESHRTSSVQPDQQELGWRTAHRYRQDPQIHRYHQNGIRPYRQRLSHPGDLPHRNQDLGRGNASTQPRSPRKDRSLELHYTPNSECELVHGHGLRLTCVEAVLAGSAALAAITETVVAEGTPPGAV
ncbi:MAG TPA: ISAzo13 family transposase [Bryobacteraceae bacterium]|nr:ISAzo13 family transposase [Bryobacteraceae bacterium]